MNFRIIALASVALIAYGQRKPGSPLDHLPENIAVLTHFGERADLSPDNRQVAFMAKSFGDAFVQDLMTKEIRCLTCNIPAASFLRVMHLPSGDFLLVGPERFKDIDTSRRAEAELWFLSKRQGSRPVRLGERVSEGVAISKTSHKLGWAVSHRQNAGVPEGKSRIVTADLELSGGQPHIANKRTVYETDARSCFIEAQNFYAKDAKMTFTCNEPDGKASVMGLVFATSTVTNFSNAPGTYNEVEAIFPDEAFVAVEADRQAQQLAGPGGEANIAIWKLKLDRTGKSFERLTRFNDHEGWVASNPVISRNGHFMVFQVGRSEAEAGVGFGLLLYRFHRFLGRRL
jgi:hypothetical protein